MLKVTAKDDRLVLSPRSLIVRELLWALRRRLSVPNPAYARNQANGFSTWLVPDIVRYLREDESTVSVPLSFGTELIKLLAEHGQVHILEESARMAISTLHPWSPRLDDTPEVDSRIRWTKTGYADDRRADHIQDVILESTLDKARNRLICSDISGRCFGLKRAALVLTTCPRHAMKLSIDLETADRATMALVPNMTQEQKTLMIRLLTTDYRGVLTSVDTLVSPLQPEWFGQVYIASAIELSDDVRRLISSILLQSKGEPVVFDYADPAPLLNHKAKFRGKFYSSIRQNEDQSWSHGENIKALVTGIAV